MFHRVKTQEKINEDNDGFKNNESKSSAEIYAASRQQNAANQSESNNPTQQKKDDHMNAQNNANTENKQDTQGQSQVDIPTGQNAQRPGMPAGRAPYASYPGSAPQGFSGPASVTDASGSNDRKLIIGRGISLSGEIDACDYLIVEGTVEAALKGANTLEVAEEGTFYGTVDINNATIAGRFEGDLTVNGRLTIKSSGSITGSVAYKELEVEAGAVLEGKVGPIDSKTASQQKKSETKTTASAAKPKQSASVNSGTELPFEMQAAE